MSSVNQQFKKALSGEFRDAATQVSLQALKVTQYR